MGIIQIHFGHYVGDAATDTEFLRIFCVGMGPLQLGVVLVSNVLFLFSVILPCI